MSMMAQLAEKSYVPDGILRFGIRRLLARRLRQENIAEPQALAARKRKLIDEVSIGPVATAQKEANAQHYEVPTAFYEAVLGPHLKYSSGLWAGTDDSLRLAEARMLALTCERADLQGGQRILELGCGWGSLSLWMAERYPQSRITAVSNSVSQKRFIDAQARSRGLGNLEVITADVADFMPTGRFDRVVSVEMFEHMRNHRELLRRIHGWLTPAGKLFVHIFCHREAFYLFEDEGDTSWMARAFFTGGVMPSFDLLPQLADGFTLEHHWQVNGVHYSRSLEAWLDNVDRQRAQLLQLLHPELGDQATVWLQRWRIFFMACSELFRYREGKEWFVGHYLFKAI